MLKKGCHGTSVFCDGKALRSATFLHVFGIVNQDSITSAAILQDTLSRIKNLNAAIQNFYVRSDNTGCYHSVYGIGVGHALTK